MAAADIETFRNRIIDSGYVLDPEGVHHEFVSGMHGRKLDFDNITDDDPLYDEWIGVTAGFIQDQFPELPEVILGVANGTNRVALDIARKFGGNAVGLVSEKAADNSKVLYLNPLAGRLIAALKPKLAVVVEDVGTTGSNSVQVAVEAQAAGAETVEVITTWQRRPELEKLRAARIPYRAIIDEPLTTYEPDICRADGYCGQGWKFIPRSK